MIKMFRILSVVTIFVLFSLGTYSEELPSGNDGQSGMAGSDGFNGKPGKVGINWTPFDPNPEYFFYQPIISTNIAEFQKVLASGAKINWPMSNISGRPTAFEVAMQKQWLDGVKLMFNHAEMKNRPNLRIQLKAPSGREINVYEFLTISKILNEKGQLISSRFMVSSRQLEILELVLKNENDLEDLENATGAKWPTSFVLPALRNKENPYFQYPNNLEALRLIEERIAQLRSNSVEISKSAEIAE
jgi:hypothetical protein